MANSIRDKIRRLIGSISSKPRVTISGVNISHSVVGGSIFIGEQVVVDGVVVQDLRNVGPAVLLPEDDWFNLPLSVINVESGRAEDFAVQAYAFAEDMGWKKPEFVQWVWSDPAGKLPWQQGYDKARFDKAQPVLARFM